MTYTTIKVNNSENIANVEYIFFPLRIGPYGSKRKASWKLMGNFIYLLNQYKPSPLKKLKWVRLRLHE